MKGLGFALITVFLASLYSIFAKYLVNSLEPLAIQTMRYVLASVVLLVFIYYKRRLENLKAVSARHVLFIAAISFFSAFAGPLLYLYGLKFTSVINSVLVFKMEVVITSLLAVVMVKERVTKHQIMGAAIMFLGVLVTISNGNFSNFSLNWGDVLVFFSVLAFSTGTVFFKKFVHRVPAEDVVMLRNIFGALFFVLASAFAIDYMEVIPQMSLDLVAVLLAMVILPTTIGVYCFYRALQVSKASELATVALLTPIFTSILAVAFLGETLSIWQLIGGVLIIGGLVFLEVHFRKVRPRHKRRRNLKLKHWHH